MILVFWLGTFILSFLALGLIVLAIFYQRNLHRFKIQESDSLLKASLESEKIERKRISSELHDGLQGDLNTVANFIALSMRVSDDNDRVIALRAAKDSVEKAIANTRNLSQKLMPPLIEEGGFILAVTYYFDSINESTGKSFVLIVDDPGIIVPNIVAYELYRIIQEFCNNMFKHGKINQFTCSVYSNENNITIELIDDGISYDFKACYLQSEGIGLRSIQSRLKFINGVLEQLPVLKGNHFVITVNN